MVVHPTEGRFQFSLRHAALGMLTICIYFGMVRSFGEFRATLVMGVTVIALSIVMLRIENMVVGGLFGTILATAILIATTMAFADGHSTEALLVDLLYPAIGYTVGVIFAADRQFRAG